MRRTPSVKNEMPMRRAFVSCLIAAALSGCMLGPNYKRPPAEAPATFRFAEGDAKELANTAWWEQFQDPVLNDLIPGRVDAYFGNLPTILPPVRGGLIRGLGVTSPTRFPIAMEIPTIAESGLPGYDVTTWQALFAPAKTPQATAMTPAQRDTCFTRRSAFPPTVSLGGRHWGVRVAYRSQTQGQSRSRHRVGSFSAGAKECRKTGTRLGWIAPNWSLPRRVGRICKEFACFPGGKCQP